MVIDKEKLRERKNIKGKCKEIKKIIKEATSNLLYSRYKYSSFHLHPPMFHIVVLSQTYITRRGKRTTLTN